jgi:hypothetical protein
MRMLIAALLGGVSLSGCAAPSSTSFVGPSGAQIHQAKCSQSPHGCYQEATKICNGSYQVLDSESHAGGLAADVLPGPVTWYGMTFSCGASDGRLPSFVFRGQQYTPPVSLIVSNMGTLLTANRIERGS